MNRRRFLKLLATVPVVAIALKWPQTASAADQIAALYRQHLGRGAAFLHQIVEVKDGTL